MHPKCWRSDGSSESPLFASWEKTPAQANCESRFLAYRDFALLMNYRSWKTPRFTRCFLVIATVVYSCFSAWAQVPAGPVEFSATGFSVSETGLTAVISVRRIQIDGDPFTVSYATSDGTAKAGQDYVAVSGVLQFARYQTNATFAVSILDDHQIEGIETVNLVLSNPTAGATLGSRSRAVLNIVDDGTTRPGELDSTFNPGAGVNGTAYALALTTPGKIIVGGDFASINGEVRQGLAELQADGSVDLTFAPVLDSGDRVYAVVKQRDERLLIGGTFGRVAGISRPRIARLLSNGALDSSFDPGSGADAPVRAIAMQRDGKILLGGAFAHVNAQSRSFVARLNADGSLDAAFNPSVNGAVNCLVVQPDNRILVGGSFTSVNAATRIFVARLNQDGSLDSSFDSSNDVHDGTGVNGLALQTDGNVVLCGDFTILFGRGQSALMRLHSNGAFDESFGANVPTGNAIYSVALQADGKILIGGNFARLSDPQCCPLYSRNGIARLNRDGSVDQSFAPGTGTSPQDLRAIVVQPDLKVVLGGGFASFNGVASPGIARLQGDMPPMIRRITYLADNQVELSILNEPNRIYIVETSTNTIDWAPVATNLTQTSLYNFVDPNPANTTRRFYRVRQMTPQP